MSQKAAEAAFNGGLNDVKSMNKTPRQRARKVEATFAELDHVRALPLQGSFYSLPDFSNVIDTLDGVDGDEQFGEWLLDELGLSMVPGSAFAAPGHMRLSFATADKTLDDALGRLRRAFG